MKLCLALLLLAFATAEVTNTIVKNKFGKTSFIFRCN
jgi:hypothetical protein